MFLRILVHYEFIRLELRDELTELNLILLMNFNWSRASRATFQLFPHGA